MKKTLVVALALVGGASPWSEPTTPAPHRVERQVYLMGTLATLVSYGGSRQEGLGQLESMVRVLEDTEAELSTWRPDSPLSRLNRQPVGLPLQTSSRLCRLLGDLFFWQEETGRAFDPALGTLIDVWGIRKTGRRPGARALADALAQSGLQFLRVDRSNCAVTRLRAVTIDEGAFGKGEGLDRVRQRAGSEGAPWLIDLGGQIAVQGGPPGLAGWDIALAHPLRRHESLLTLNLTGGSLSTSGGSARDLKVGAMPIGHIIDPRTGQPVTRRGSVTVWHQQALVADILSTALYVMGPEEGLAWASARGVAACFLTAREVDDARDVEVRATPTFARRFPAVQPFVSAPQSGICCP